MLREGQRHLLRILGIRLEGILSHHWAPALGAGGIVHNTKYSIRNSQHVPGTHVPGSAPTRNPVLQLL